MAEIDLEAAIERARKRAAEKAGSVGPTADAAPDAEAGDIPAPEFDLDERLAAARQRVLDKGGTVGREPPAEPTMGRGQDFGLSLGTGLQEGVTKLPGIVGDLQKTIHDKVQDWTGLDTSKIPALNPAMVPLGFGKQMPTGEDIQDKYTELTRGRFTHEPQYDTGEYGKEIGEFMPNFLGGPVGGARGAALKLGTRVVGPALATKSLGDVVDKYLPESWAPTVKTGIAALSGGAGIAGEEMAAGKSLRAAKEGIPGRATPTGKEIHQASESQYDEFAKSPVRIKKGTTNIFGMNLETTLNNKGFFDTPTSAPTVHATVRHFLKNADAPMTALEWKEARKALGQSAFKGIGSERAAGAMAIKHLDAWWKDLKQRQLAQGSIKDLDVSKELLEKANKNYGAYQRDLAYQRLINKGKRQAGAAYSGMNVDNSLRGKFRTMLDKEESSRALGLSPEEFQQAEGVAAGSPAANRARKVGNLGGGGMGIGTGLLGLGSLGPAYFLDPKFAVALTLPAAGIGARMRANRLTERAAKAAQENLRRRSPLAESLPRPHVRTPKDELWERAMILAELQRLNAEKTGQGQ